VEKKKPVVIEGHQFPVTENLESALRRLRNFKDPSAKASSGVSRSFWWIDAICINQEDVLERNQQVNLMTRIYKKAAGVHIWLGEQADNSEIAFQVARQIADKTPRGPGHPEIVYPETTAEQRDMYRKAVAKLCARPWWERVWVRQEVAVANEATVHCGNESCSFHALTLTLDILNKIDEELGFKAIQEPIPNPKSDTDVLRTTAYRRAWILTYYRSNQGQGPTAAYQDLRTLILHTRSCQATDARDKVFSMLGLADPDFWGLKADYRLSITETFIAAARCLITKKQSLDILSGCQNPERRNGLPSWAPNLTDGWKARPFLTTGTRHCAEVMAGEPPDFVFKGEGDSILMARGFQLDVIETLSDETPHQDATNDELDALSAKWKALAATALSNPDIYVLDRGSISKYKDDGPWIEFLSIHVDRGHALPKAAAQLKVPGDYRMAKSLLLPSEEEVSVVDVKGVKNRVLEHLRKNGVGRRLGVTRMGKDKGSVVLVPANSVVGDEIWLFRGTNFPYVLRRRSEGEYVVVGETCEYFILRGQGSFADPECRF
jgi:hypothetical protein